MDANRGSPTSQRVNVRRTVTKSKHYLNTTLGREPFSGVDDPLAHTGGRRVATAETTSVDKDHATVQVSSTEERLQGQRIVLAGWRRVPTDTLVTDLKSRAGSTERDLDV